MVSWNSFALPLLFVSSCKPAVWLFLQCTTKIEWFPHIWSCSSHLLMHLWFAHTHTHTHCCAFAHAFHTPVPVSCLQTFILYHIFGHHLAVFSLSSLFHPYARFCLDMGMMGQKRHLSFQTWDKPLCFIFFCMLHKLFCCAHIAAFLVFYVSAPLPALGVLSLNKQWFFSLPPPQSQHMDIPNRHDIPHWVAILLPDSCLSDFYHGWFVCQVRSRTPFSHTPHPHLPIHAHIMFYFSFLLFCCGHLHCCDNSSFPWQRI